MTLYIDADACPVKEEAIRVAERYGTEVYLVSGSGSYTRGRPKVHSIIAGDKFDAADDWIAERAGPGDVVVTGDIPLAARALEKGAAVISHHGRPFSKDTIGAAMGMRAFQQHLRETGESKGYNAPFAKEDRSRFLQTLDMAFQRFRPGREIFPE